MRTIGAFSLGRLIRTGSRRKKIIAKIKTKMRIWRDNARLNIIQQGIRYARKIKLNKRLMEIRKADNPKSLNFSAFSSQPRQRDILDLKLSTIPEKPRYSDMKPKKRLYGMRLKRIISK